MTGNADLVPYSFSMVNLVKLMPEWNRQKFDRFMLIADTRRVELVPGMILGSDWDRQIDQSSACRDALAHLMSGYTVTSIQSLTYGLHINLGDALKSNNDLLRRFQSLARLGDMLKCKVFVLGSPGQKKLKPPHADPVALKQLFIENCAWIASVLGPDRVLSLEHNTSAQGAEFCNTLSDVVEVVLSLRALGALNVGLNLDTKCLIDEFGVNVGLRRMICEYRLCDIVTSIQVSLDFLARSDSQAREDEIALLQLANDLCCPISLEEFGLAEDRLSSFMALWNGVRRF